MSSKNINNYGSTAETEDKVQTAGTTNTYKTNDIVSNGYKNFSNKCILREAVIFCQHGFLGHDKTTLPLLEVLENKILKNDSYAYFCKDILDYNELSDFNLTLKDILDTHAKYLEKNIFVRTIFSNPIYGNVKAQASQLKEMINKVREKSPTIPVALIGYSKGGVVNLKCAINNPCLIDIVANIIQNGDNIVDCYKLAHLDIFGIQKFILTHDEILYHVVEGLNA